MYIMRMVGLHWVVAVIIYLAALPASAFEERVESFTLRNGMEVVVVENHRVPAVSHTLWYRVGAADDPQGRSGLAHYLEHMMFKGTKAHSGTAYAKKIGRLGGQSNAFTGRDFTGYYVNIATSQLELVMALEADRMRGLAPADEEFLRERDVILEERKMVVENKPLAVLAEEMDALLYRHHPYQTPIIGWKHEIQKLSKADVMSHYHRYYRPANALLVVAGDITAQKLKPLAEKYYGSIPSGMIMPRQWTQEPPHRGPRRITLHDANTTQPIWYKSYIAPSLLEGDKSKVFPLFVLAQLLGGGETSVLYRKLVVEQKLASHVSVDYSALQRGHGDINIYAVPAEAVSMQRLEVAIDAAITEFIKTAVSEASLARTKTLLKAEVIYAQDSLEGVARMVGQLRVLGLPMEVFTRWQEAVAKVTADQVKDAAQHVFDENASVTGWLLPAQEGRK